LAGLGFDGIVKALRPRQWVKNTLVFAGLVFGQKLLDTGAVVSSLVAFASMCFAASAVYLLNDLCDVEADRQHPLKRARPLASGAVSLGAARAWMTGLSLASLVLGFALNPAAGWTVVAYLLINIAYSLGAKHLVILDVMILAAGYVLRVLLGVFAVQVPASHWLVLCTLNVALFLGLGKRRAELAASEDDAANHRRVLEHYSLGFLDQMIAIVTSGTLVFYILYTVDQRTVAEFDTYMLVATVPLVMYGLFRYLYLLYHLKQGDNPTTTILFDRAFLVNAFLWGIMCVVIVYAPDWLPDWSPQ
jgi:4-hydroxybenzoate polyprenyltransferase